MKQVTKSPLRPVSNVSFADKQGLAIDLKALALGGFEMPVVTLVIAISLAVWAFSTDDDLQGGQLASLPLEQVANARPAPTLAPILVKRRPIKRIVLHHTAEKLDCGFECVQKMHLVNGWDGIGYHILVEYPLNGETVDQLIKRGRPDNKVGAGAYGHNSDTIHVAFVGNEDTPLHPKQKQALTEVLAWYQATYSIHADKIVGHDALNDTACPNSHGLQFLREYKKVPLTKAQRFEKHLSRLLRLEGGFSNHKADPGGATNYGITQATYNAYRKSHGLATKGVRDITKAEVKAIYYNNYYKASGAHATDDDRLAYVLFDTAVLFGVDRAKRWVAQANYNVAELKLIRAHHHLRVRHVANFGRGWANRNESL